MKDMLTSAFSSMRRLLCVLALSGIPTHTTAYAASPLVPWLSADGKYGFSDANGQVVLPPSYERASIFSEGRAAVAVDGKWGYIDEGGEWIVRPRFDRATQYRGGKAVTAIIRSGGLTYRDRGKMDQPYVGGGCGFLPICGSPREYYYSFTQFNAKGSVEVSWRSRSGAPPFDRVEITDNLRQFDANLSDFPKPIQELIGENIKVNSVIPLYALGSSMEQLAFFDASGHQVTPATYVRAANLLSGDNNPIYYSQTAFLRWIDGETWKSHNQRPRTIWRFWDGRLRVGKLNVSKRWPLSSFEGYLDENGKEVIPPQFSDASDFEGGFAKVRRLDEGSSIIDRDGNAVFPANGEFGALDEASLEAGYALGVTNLRRKLVVNLRTRQIVHSFDKDIYKNIKIIASGGHVALTAVKTGAKTLEDAGVCVLTLKGAVIACGFEVAKDAGEGVIAVRVAGLWGAIEYGGTVIFEPRYKYKSSPTIRDAEGYEWIRPPFYFEGSYAEVEQPDGDRSFYINRQGREFRDAPKARDHF